MATNAAEEVAFRERTVDEHRDATLASERQDAALGVALTERIVHLHEVERLAPQDALELVVRARRVVQLVDDAGALRFHERVVVCDSSRVDTLLAIPL